MANKSYKEKRLPEEKRDYDNLSEDIDNVLNNIGFRNNLEANILGLEKAITKNIGLYVSMEQRTIIQDGKKVLGKPMCYIKQEAGKSKLYFLIEETMKLVYNCNDNKELNSLKDDLESMLKDGVHDTDVLKKRVRRLIEVAKKRLD